MNAVKRPDLPIADWLPARGGGRRSRGGVHRQRGGDSRRRGGGGTGRSWSMLSRATAQEGLEATVRERDTGPFWTGTIIYAAYTSIHCSLHAHIYCTYTVMTHIRLVKDQKRACYWSHAQIKKLNIAQVDVRMSVKCDVFIFIPKYKTKQKTNTDFFLKKSIIEP